MVPDFVHHFLKWSINRFLKSTFSSDFFLFCRFLHLVGKMIPEYSYGFCPSQFIVEKWIFKKYFSDFFLIFHLNSTDNCSVICLCRIILYTIFYMSDLKIYIFLIFYISSQMALTSFTFTLNLTGKCSVIYLCRTILSKGVWLKATNKGV